jgi:hypothetical protein
MRRLSFTHRNRSDNLLHVETDLGIVNIHVNLHRQEDGAAVESIEIRPDRGTKVLLDDEELDYLRVRIVAPRELGL